MHPVHLLQLTDPHLYADDEGEIYGVNTARSLGRVLSEAFAAGSPRADAIVVTGDIADDLSAGAYRRLRAALESLDVPVYCLPGNHDDPELMAELLATGRFQFCGRAELGAWGLVMVNTHVPGEVTGHVGRNELARIETDVEGFAGRPVVVCLHHPPVAVGSAWIDALGLSNSSEFVAMLERHPQVRAVLAGHVHQAHEMTLGSVRYLTAPSTCAQFRPQTVRSEIDSLPPGYRRLVLHPDGTFETEARWLSE